ncbi:phage tail tape measure protein [Cytobacillus oceanisediminis]|uniref:phage tail tape measure protein n=1 Tax=Cytobacillus oceanisediminis TaxID=665099 RepID=UPI00207A52B7|nr:phage tail tape measure protein [Cytobacillus oceanisediminis]USK43720.1 transglycosylase SLT domain-containing protein [Cytobacillus oceanisediminis]
MAERIEGLSIGLDLDTLSLDRGFSGLKDRLRTINSEMKLNMSAFDRGERSVEKYQTQLQGLNRKLEVQKQVVTQARAEYQRMVQEHGEGSAEAERAAREYNNQAASLNNLERYIGRVNQDLQSLQEEQQNATRAWTRFSNAAQNAQETLTGVGDSLKGAGETMTTSLTLPMVGFGAIAGKVANDLDAAAGIIQTELGVSAKEAENLEKTANDLWKNGFGEDLAASAERVAGITKALGDLGDVDLSYVAKGLDLFEKRGWGDQEEALRAVKILTEQFGLSAREAMDRLTRGFQDNLNFSGEFLDSVSEYSTYFSEFGFSSDDMFAKLKSGAESGAFQLDKVGDAMKEFSLRAKDGSKTSTEAFQALGLNASTMTKEFNKGGDTAKKAFEKVVKALQKTDNEAVKNTASVNLFGTQYEDLGEKAFDALLTAGEGLGKVENATQKASDALQNNFGARSTKLWRNFLTDLEPVGQVLLDFGEDILPKVSNTVDKVTSSFNELSPEAKNTVLVIAGLVAGVGPLITGLGFAATGVGALAGALPLLAGPVGITAAAITGLGLGFMALDKEMDKPIIKSDIFAGKISSATEKAVGSYMKLHNEAEAELNTLAARQGEITDEMANSLISKYQQMGDQVLQAMKVNHADQLAEQQKLFDDSKVLTEQEEQKRMLRLQEKQLEEIEQHNATQQRKLEIIRTANDENRILTESELAELANLNKKSQEKAIEELSANQQEQLTILNNMKNQKSILEAEEAANTVKTSVKTMNKVVEDANKTYNQKVAAAEEGRDVLGTITAEEASAMIAEAERKKNETVTKAQDMHYDVIKEAQAQAGKHVDEVNWETGEVLKEWDQMYNGVLKAWNWVRGLFGKAPLSKKGSVKETGRQAQRRQDARLAPGYAVGTPSSGHPGGPAIVGEEGPELAHIPGQGVTLLGMKGAEFHSNFPKGSSVLPNPLTENLLKSYGFPGYKDGIGDYFDVFLNGAGNVWDLVKKKFNLKDSIFPSWMKNHTGNPLSAIGDMAKSSIKEMWDNWFSFDAGSIKGSGVQRWSGVAAKALMMTGQYTKANLDRLLYQMKTESGGNPRAINLWDINAKRGIPSKGLMQVIDPTFRAYAMPGFNHNIYDPLSNILASIRYAVSRYGSLSKAYRGVGYASGGLINSEGLYQLAEGGWPEWVIPTDPSRRTDAMKLLALAGREITRNKRPQQLPNVPSGNNDYSILKDLLDATIQQNQTLVKILQVLGSQGGLDVRSLAQILSEPMREIIDFNNERNKTFEGRAY